MTIGTIWIYSEHSYLIGVFILSSNAKPLLNAFE